MNTNLSIRVHTAGGLIPLKNAVVFVYSEDRNFSVSLLTDINGRADIVIPEPDDKYGKWQENINIRAADFDFSEHSEKFKVTGGENNICNINLIPVAVKEEYSDDIFVDFSDKEAEQLAVRYRKGDKGIDIRILNEQLNYVSQFVRGMPYIFNAGDIYSASTVTAVQQFRRAAGLPDGENINQQTYDMLQIYYRAANFLTEYMQKKENYKVSEIYKNKLNYFRAEPYPGRIFSYNDTGDDIMYFKSYLRAVSAYDKNITEVDVNRVFDAQMLIVLRQIQDIYGLPKSSTVGYIMWSSVAKIYNFISSKYCIY